MPSACRLSQTLGVMKQITAALLIFFGLPAMACSSLKQPTNEELFANASSVFRARVTEAKLVVITYSSASSKIVEVVEARYEVKEIFKGTPPASGVVRDLPYGPGNCSLGLLPGVEYVFYPGEQDMVLLPSGSFAFINPDGNEVKPRLEELRKLSGAIRK